MHPHTLLLLSLLLLFPSIGALRGAHPSNRTSLQSGVKCVPRDTPHLPALTLAASRVNDDYCDCLHGEDEPGTSACPGASFWCAPRGHKPRRLPSSWVDDGSCDCCDGSDEPPGTCPDTCAEDAARLRAKARRHAQEIRHGVAVRVRYAAEAKRSSERDQKELRRLERELKALGARLKRSVARADGLRRRKEHVDRVKRAAEEASQPSPADRGIDEHVEMPDDQSGAHLDVDGADGEGDGEGVEKSERDAEAPVSRDSADNSDAGDTDDASGRGNKVGEHSEQQGTEERQGDNDGDEESILEDKESRQTDLGESESGLDKDPEEADDEKYLDDDDDVDDDDMDEDDVDDDFLDDELESDNTHEDHSETSSDPEDSEKADISQEAEEEASPVDVDSVCAELESKGTNVILRSIAYVKAALGSKLRRILPRVLQGGAEKESSKINECLSQAENAKWDLESKKSDLEGKIKKLNEKNEIDYGSDGALRKLHGSCTKKKITQYEFEICPFDLVRQYEHGSAIAVLGRFSGWEGEGAEKKMSYPGGDHCWNGPARSIKVELACGKTEDIVSVEEPNRCTYVMKFETPAVCEEKAADAILAAFEEVEEVKQEL